MKEFWVPGCDCNTRRVGILEYCGSWAQLSYFSPYIKGSNRKVTQTHPEKTLIHSDWHTIVDTLLSAVFLTSSQLSHLKRTFTSSLSAPTHNYYYTYQSIFKCGTLVVAPFPNPSCNVRIPAPCRGLRLVGAPACEPGNLLCLATSRLPHKANDCHARPQYTSCKPKFPPNSAKMLHPSNATQLFHPPWLT